MTRAEMKRLQKGDRVTSEHRLGFVQEADAHKGVYIEWSDGVYGWIEYDRADILEFAYHGGH